MLLGVLVAALSGLFGPGPLSWTEESDGALTVSYERFTRRGGTSTIAVRAAATESGGGDVAVRFDRRYLANFTVNSITPNPESTSLEGRWIVYTFATSPGAEGLLVEYAVTPTGLWAADGAISLTHGAVVTPSHFIYP